MKLVRVGTGRWNVSRDVRTGVGGAGPKPRAPIERASPVDLMELAADASGSPMQVAAVLVLDTGLAPGLSAIRDTVAERIRVVPRLRQRLVRAPFACGRPVWVDDPGFDIRNHVRTVRCPAPGDERALLDVAAETAMDPLPLAKPLWSATLVTGLAGGGAALIVVFHHVLADGIGGLAVLAHLVDGGPMAPPSGLFPRPVPPRHRLFADALGSRSRAFAHLPAGVRRLRSAVAELAPGGTVRPPRCSLNRPTGPRRALAVARTDLTAVLEVAHAYGGTVNDVVLTAVTGALHTVLRRRGETVDRFVVSVPVSARREASATQLGNQVGVIPVALPATGDPLGRLATIARITRNRKTAAPGSSAALLGPVFRAIAGLGAFRWFVDRQRLVTTFVTNLRGPDTALSFLGAPVTDVIPLSTITGNITVAFAALSYAGTLVVTVVADPENCPDLPVLAAQLQSELDAVTATPPAGRRGRPPSPAAW